MRQLIIGQGKRQGVCEMVMCCPVCTGEKISLLCHKNKQVYLVCDKCGHSFVQDWVGKKEKRQSNSPPKNKKTSDSKLVWDYSSFKKEHVFFPRLDQIEKLISRDRILDIGCANGAFLKAADDRGWKTQGVELRQKSIDIARDNGIEVLTEPLEVLNLPANFYSAVTMWQVVEHLPDPVAVLQDCHRILKLGGILAISTPNLKSIGWMLLKKNWPAVDPSAHPHLFSPSSLSLLLNNCGFTKCHLETLDILPASVKLFKRKLTRKKITKPSNAVASLASSSSKTNMKGLFFCRKMLNVPLKLAGLGEDIYAYYRKVEDPVVSGK